MRFSSEVRRQQHTPNAELGGVLHGMFRAVLDDLPVFIEHLEVGLKR
jgi:hypothetical protein